MTQDPTKAPRLDDFAGDRTARPPRQDVDLTKATAEPAPKTQIPATKEEQAAEKKVAMYEGMVNQDLAPVEDYQAFLKANSIDPDKAATIVDDLVIKGYYEEEYHITKRTSVTFRTRQHMDMLRMQRHIEAVRPIFNDTMTETMIRFNLAGSLSRFGKTVFEFPSETDNLNRAEELFDKRLQAVEHMPYALLVNITNKLAKFDRMVNAVMREGVAENF